MSEPRTYRSYEVPPHLEGPIENDRVGVRLSRARTLPFFCIERKCPTCQGVLEQLPKAVLYVPGGLMELTHFCRPCEYVIIYVIGGIRDHGYFLAKEPA